MLKSTVHRVGFTASASSEEQERYSMAYFCHPLDEVELSAVPSPVIEAFGAKGADELEAQRSKVGWKVKDGVLTAKEHLDRRLNVTYGLGK